MILTQFNNYADPFQPVNVLFRDPLWQKTVITVICKITCHDSSVIALSETQGEADHRAGDFSGSLHPVGLPGLPRCAYTRVPEGGEVVVFGVAVLRGDHPHHGWLRRLRTRYRRPATNKKCHSVMRCVAASVF